MPNPKAEKVEDILIEAGLINDEQLKNAQDIHLLTGENIEKILLSEGMNNYKETLIPLAAKMGVEYVDLENIKVNKEAISKISPQIAQRYFIFPFDIKNNMLFVAMRNPDDIFVLDEIKVFAQTEIKPYLADSRLITKALDYFYKIDTVKESIKNNNIKNDNTKNDNTKNLSAIDEKGKPTVNVNAAANKMYGKDVETNITHDPSSNELEYTIKSIILKAIKLDASDIHIDSFLKQLRVRYRVDGKLMEEKSFTKANPDALIVRIKVMAGLFACDRNIPQKGRINYEINRNEKISLDVLTLPTVSGEKILLRLENLCSVLSLEELGLSDYEKNCIDVMFRRKSGMIVVSGMSGNGNSTTAYALIKKILSEDLNIITLEKKILEKIEGVNQIQVTARNEEAANQLIKSAIEHDPDVLMVDMEVDNSDIKLLMNAALGGKLVILTLNFPNTFEVLSGLIHMGFEPYKVAAAVEGVITQHLVRKLCTFCKSKTIYGNSKNDANPVANREERCETCNNSGYKGKTGVFEVFNMTREYRKLLSKSSNLNIMEAKIENEKSTYEKNCIRLVNDEVTSIEEIVRSGLGKGIFEN